MNNSETTKQQRQNLKGISNTLRQAKEKGEIKNINEGLKQIYAQQGHLNLQTFNDWKKEGKKIKKGEKAIYLWREQIEKKIIKNGKLIKFTYFPLLAVFSENQVYTPSNNK